MASEASGESAEVVDWLPKYREECGEHHCAQLKAKLDSCNERVRARMRTEETCHEEMIDFMHCVDHCAMPKLWNKLK